MSTIKVTNIQNPSSGTDDIQIATNGDVTIGGLSLDAAAAADSVNLDASGRLLVGTSSAPTAATTLVLKGNSTSTSTQGRLHFQRSGVPNDGNPLGDITFMDTSDGVSGSIAVVRDGGTWTAGTSTPGRLVFSTTADGASSPTERMRIRNNGALDNFSSGPTVHSLRSSSAAGTTDRLVDGTRSATNTLNGTLVYRVFTNGDVVNTNNSYGPLASDERLKQDIVDANSQWDDIKNIRLTNFRYKNDPAGPLQLGPIAQELEQVSPGLVTRRPASEDEVADPSNGLVDGDEVLSFKASILYMKAVKALQEAMERIETLEAKVAALESA